VTATRNEPAASAGGRTHHGQAFAFFRETGQATKAAVGFVLGVGGGILLLSAAQGAFAMAIEACGSSLGAWRPLLPALPTYAPPFDAPTAAHGSSGTACDTETRLIGWGAAWTGARAQSASPVRRLPRPNK
jgi:hypothetical protein